MAHEIFFRKIHTYAPLSETAQNAWDKLLRRKRYSKGDDFVTEGQIPTSFAFVVEGLFYQHYTGREGDRVIKYFFPEHRIAASVSATLSGQPSVFTITAIEDSVVLVITELAQTDAPNLVAITHGTVISLFVAAHNDIDGFELWKQLACPSFVVLKVDATRCSG